MPTKRYSKTLVCFANSRKTGGRCVAGKEWRDGRPGNWVRPISARPTHELSIAECSYQNRRVPKLLDIVEIDFKCHQPVAHQLENHCIDPDCYWEKRGHLSRDDLDQWIDNPTKLCNRSGNPIFLSPATLEQLIHSLFRLWCFYPPIPKCFLPWVILTCANPLTAFQWYWFGQASWIPGLHNIDLIKKVIFHR